MNISYRAKDGGIQAIISYKSGGKWKQKSKQGFKTKKEAVKWVEKASLSILEDKADNIERNDMTLSRLCLLFLSTKENQVRENSARLYEKTVKILDDTLLAKKVCDITPYDITNYFLELRKESGNSYTNYMQILRTIFQFAVSDLKIIRSNPVKILKNNRKDERILYVTKDLYEHILKATSNTKYKLALKILYHTGIRYGEMMGITINDINANTLIVNKQFNRVSNSFAPLKTENSEREIPIPEWLSQEMKSVKNIGIDGRIFPKYFMIQAFLSGFNVSPHCFRHTYATNLVHQGINLKVASDILGDTFETFCKTYVESSKDLAQEEYKKIIANF